MQNTIIIAGWFPLLISIIILQSDPIVFSALPHLPSPAVPRAGILGFHVVNFLPNRTRIVHVTHVVDSLEIAPIRAHTLERQRLADDLVFFWTQLFFFERHCLNRTMIPLINNNLVSMI
jgi:hypothetical protein